MGKNVGCFFAGFAITPPLQGASTVSSMVQCQMQCSATPSCSFFSYWNSTGACTFAALQAEKVSSPDGVVSGSSVCPIKDAHMSDPICSSEVPKDGFPHYVANASHSAWPSGKQPQSLECWPRSFHGQLRDCKGVTVLEDATTGWPGTCSQMQKRDGLPGVSVEKACGEMCRMDPSCPAWIVGSDGACYHGMGHNCFHSKDFTASAGQRLQHGHVRRLMTLAGWQILGLARVFHDIEWYFKSTEEAIEACKEQCYSDLNCQFWQYAAGYGCWVEDVSQPYRPAYPLTLDFASRETPFAVACKDGEYIQHYCPAGDVQWPKPAACSDVGVIYVAPQAVLVNATTFTSSAGACQVACASSPPCEVYTFYPNGTCVMNLHTAVRQQTFGLETSGPMACDAPWMSTGVAPSSPTVVTQTDKAKAWCDPTSPALKFANVNLTMENLEYSKLSDKEVADLVSMYHGELSALMEKQASSLADPYGSGSAVVLKPGNAKSTFIQAWVPNRPPTSCGWTWLGQVLQDPGFVTRMRDDTLARLGLGHLAIHGNVQVMQGEIFYHSGKFTRHMAFWQLALLILLILSCCGICVVGLSRSKRLRRRLGALVPAADYHDFDSDSDKTEEQSSFGGLLWQRLEEPSPRKSNSDAETYSPSVRPQSPQARGDFNA